MRLLAALTLALPVCRPPVVPVATTVPVTTTTVVHASRSRPPSVVASTNTTLACIRAIESGGNYRAVSRSGKYRGAYQFDMATFEANGGSGDPAAASVAEQDRVALVLLSRRGLAPWPTPSRRCA